MRWAKYAVTLIAVVLLLSPALMMNLVWTKLDLAVSMVAIATCVVVALNAPRWRWLLAVISSLLIAVPPYPYWVFAGEERGWYLHFFNGYSVSEVPFARFACVSIMALLLFGALFWSLGITARKGSG